MLRKYSITGCNERFQVKMDNVRFTIAGLRFRRNLKFVFLASLF